MRDLLIRWLGIRKGEIGAYQHIVSAIDKHEFNAKQVQSLCRNMIKSIEPLIKEDELKLEKINKAK